jgi:hypothetical protein
MASVAEDQEGNLGFVWIESSSNEYLSAWVGNLYTNGALSSQVAAPGGGFFPVSFRIGDYRHNCGRSVRWQDFLGGQ